jgi:inorganic pyrophosphatase
LNNIQAEKNDMSLINVVIETPRNSPVKYSYNSKSGTFILKKRLPAGMVFPFDFGFIPQTEGEDGDPLDALVISEFETFPGCRIDCRLIGVLQAEQTEKGKTIRNDRYFFVPEISLLYQHIKTVGDLPPQLSKELLLFFVAYNKAAGKEFKPLKIVAAGKAASLLKKAS